MPAYQISHEAKLDLEMIWLYTSRNWSIAQADRYINLILDEIEYLANNLALNHPGAINFNKYQRSRVKSHFIFYKVESDSSSVRVVRILHKHMDFDSHLD